MKAVADAPEDAHNGKHDALHDEQSTGNGALIDAGVGEKLQTAAMISPKTGTSWMRNIITHSETESAMVFSGRYSTARPGLEEACTALSYKTGVTPWL